MRLNQEGELIFEKQDKELRNEFLDYFKYKYLKAKYKTEQWTPGNKIKRWKMVPVAFPYWKEVSVFIEENNPNYKKHKKRMAMYKQAYDLANLL